jgi:hypothetical protein
MKAVTNIIIGGMALMEIAVIGVLIYNWDKVL